jgi:nucleoside diphosphate kinase
MEQTFVMIKPDGVQRSLVGEIISPMRKRFLNSRYEVDENHSGTSTQTLC